jgi:hypothetical protein
MVSECGVGVRGADVSTDQVRRKQQLGVADDLPAFERVDTVAGPDPIRTLNDSEVDPAATAGAGFDLQASMGKRVAHPSGDRPPPARSSSRCLSCGSWLTSPGRRRVNPQHQVDRSRQRHAQGSR